MRPFSSILLALTSLVCQASSTPPASRDLGSTIDQRERTVWRALARRSQFADVPHTSARFQCEAVQPPEALATPSPLATAWRDHRVKVSFIIGTDGRVHSPLILESAGPVGDRHVLQMVKTWRYRPATCNGIPTETEGKVEFSSR